MKDMSVSAGVAVAAELEMRSLASRIDVRYDGRQRSVFALDDFFHAVAQLVKPDLFVEAGAFDASASRRIARQVSGCRVVAFEANPNNYRIWSSHVDFAAEGVEYLQQALSNGPNRATFFLSSGSGEEYFEDNSILSSPHAKDRRRVNVPATTLDRIGKKHSGRAALWIDVEGANEQVLKGGEQFLRRCDLLKIEVEETPMWEGQWLATDVFEALLAHGLLPVARDVQFENQYNVVFVRPAVARMQGFGQLHEDLLRHQARPELPWPLAPVRRHPGARWVARGLRDSVRWVRGQSRAGTQPRAVP